MRLQKVNSPEFYIAGGTLPPDTPSYVERSADLELMDHVLNGRYCFVLTSRQTGKSSLMAQTAARLKTQNIRTATVDLTSIGTDFNRLDQWCYGTAHWIHRGLRLKFSLPTWWRNEAGNLPALHRLTEYLREALREIAPHKAVIFIDEIESILYLPETDGSDFLAAIRSIFNLRAIEPQFERLTVVLIGSAAPDQLIRDPRKTPFNIGKRVRLDDFSFEEALALGAGLSVDRDRQAAIIKRVVHWTNGHPYLTQALCEAISKTTNYTSIKGAEIHDLVDQIVALRFLQPPVQQQEVHLTYIRKLLREARWAPEAIEVFRSVLHGEKVVYDANSPPHSTLEIAGVISVNSKGELVVRNKIYQDVFSAEWPSELTASRRLSTLSWLMVVSVVAPAVAVALFRSAAVRNPSITIVLIVIYEIIVLISHLFVDVWSVLRTGWVDVITSYIYETFSSFLYRSRYRDWFFYQIRDFDVRGLTTQSTYNLELQDVLVDLKIEPKPAHAVSADPVQPVPKELTGRRSIWDYLTIPNFTKNLVLVGPPGSGKTTLLKSIALHMISNQRPRLRESIPILLFIREHASTIGESPEYSLAEAVKASLSRKAGPLPPHGWLEKRLASGRCLVLLDGLDEVVTVEARQHLIAWIETWIKAYPNCRFLITSRPHGYRSNPIEGVTVLEIQPFDSGQVRRFIQNWYLANEVLASGKADSGVAMRAQAGAEDLFRRLSNSETLTNLAVNPLLLTMIATIHRFRSSLPGRRIELYAEICEVFLGKRQQARGVETEMTSSQKQMVLQSLAFHMMCSHRREVSAEEAITIIAEPLWRILRGRNENAEERFLRDVESSSGLLLEREHNLYSFAHLVFQEYLSSVHAREQRLVDKLIDHISDPWWHETIRLYCAQGDASPILAACLSAPQPTVMTLNLAIDCLEEAREADPQWRIKTELLLKEWVEDENPERFRVAAETLLTRRLRNMVLIGDDVFVDSTYVTYAEYQLFLNDTGIGGAGRPTYGLGQKKGSWISKGRGLKPVFGVHPTDVQEFCRWLTERDPGFIFRQAEAKHLDIYTKFRPSSIVEQLMGTEEPSESTAPAIEGILLVKERRA